MQQVDFGDLQVKLQNILVSFLSNHNDSSKEEGNIISSALSLWSASLTLRHELIEDFYTWQRIPSKEDAVKTATDFVVQGIYSPKSEYVRNEFKENLELVCEKVVSNSGV